MNKTKQVQREVDDFNKRHPIGTPVQYWPVIGGKDSMRSTTRSEAQVLGGHTAVVWINGKAGCVALSHVEAVRQLAPEHESAGTGGTPQAPQGESDQG